MTELLALTPAQVERFEQLEGIIHAGLAPFQAVGSALMEIREAGLYKATHPTFEAYCAERWGISKSRAYQLITATEIVDRISTVVDVAPVNEGQARALAAFDPDLQPVIMRTAVAYSRSTGKPVTAGMLTRAGRVIEEAATTGFVDTGSGESTPLVAAMHASEFEATQRQKTHIQSHYENHDAQGRVIDRRKAFFEFVARQPCLRCGTFGVEVAHIRLLLSRKTGDVLPRRSGPAHVTVVPLCPNCHRHAPDSIHNVGEEAFSDGLGRGQGYLLRAAATLIVEFFVEGSRS